VLLLLIVDGRLGVLDPVVLLLTPFTWGAITGLGLTVWAYEPLGVRRWGERLVLGLILLYLVVGVLAGENLRHWLDLLPPAVGRKVFFAFAALHVYNPFGVLQLWLEHGFVVAWDRTWGLQTAATGLLAGLLTRAACRLQGHFHDRHYQPARDVSQSARPEVGDRPLTWWAVKRVSEYSGRINLWLAGGFGLLYAVYLMAGVYWPTWMGRRVFEMCDQAGGVAGLAAGLVLLAAVPAAFQYGLWDSNAQNRCRRLELLLLTPLQAHDYWNAAAAAAWHRGRGYFAVALLLWGAALFAGQVPVPQVIVAVAAAVLLWGLYFALGFRAFSRGAQANGLGMLLTVGLPVWAYGLSSLGWPLLGGVLPPGMVYRALSVPASLAGLLGPVLIAAATLVVARRSLRTCDTELRNWYDRHHGAKVMT
jgi:hypothetical protein